MPGNLRHLVLGSAFRGRPRPSEVVGSGRIYPKKTINHHKRKPCPTSCLPVRYSLFLAVACESNNFAATRELI
jgi:hypothetical protein